MKTLKLSVIYSLLFFSQQTLASSILTAKVFYVGTYGNGDFYVKTDTVIDEPGCSFPNGNTRFDVPANHPEIKNWLSVAMTALASGKSIKFSTVGCYEGSATLDNTRNSFFLLLN